MNPKIRCCNPILLLVLLSLISVGFVTLVDDAFAAFLNLFSDSVANLAYARFSSFALSAVILFAIDRTAFGFGRFDFLRTLNISLIWLIPAAFGIFVVKVWVPRLDGWIDYCAFMVTGLCAEEFLFRGSLYAAALRVFKSKTFLKLPVVVIYTATFFAVQHLQYHSFQITTASLSQVCYTFAMGICFGLIRHHSESIWPVIVVHMINNSFTVVRNVFPM